METFNTKYGKITLYRNETYITPSFRVNDGYWDIDNLLKVMPHINPDKNILEIGAHCGTSTIVYASFLNNTSQIFAYEPQKCMYNLLQQNIIQNNLEAKIIPYNYAVFCKTGLGQMNNIDIDGGGGEVIKRYNEEINRPCNFGGIGLGKNGENINMITVDDNMKHTNIGFIHCDAQGAENFIFSKAINTIKENRPVILFENNEKYGQYLYNNVCRSYPEFSENSKFNLEDYCMKELNYSNIIRQFNGGQDDLLIP
jgi:FkbM family methyltransferase